MQSPLKLYKPGQGKWVRMLSAIGAGMLLLAGVSWLHADVLSTSLVTQHLSGGSLMAVQYGIPVAVLVIALAVGWWLMNKRNIVDFMIATEAEMKKVNWPSKKEVAGSTWVVICGTLLMALLLFVADFVFFNFFRWIDVIHVEL